MNLHSVLEQNFGHKEFRGSQLELIERAVAGKSSLGVMPTGMGKSLCFQLPSLVLPGVTLVISPLIALMKDQVDAAKKKGIPCCAINSSLTTDERRSAYKKVKAGDFKLVYITPERFRKEEFWDAISTQTISLLAIDEAHCISQWGHDFRPDYSRVGEIWQKLGEPPVIALTATATPQVQADIRDQLKFSEEDQTFVSGVERPNLEVSKTHVFGMDEKVRLTLALLHQNQGSTIIYFSLISSLQKFSSEIFKLGIEHLVYHGQMKPQHRKSSQNQFMKSDNALILATPAFGLGVDKPNIRQVIHAELPGSLEAYYQEIGRAGRDGEKSHCHLMYDPDDVSIQMDFQKWSMPDPDFIAQVYDLMEAYPEKFLQEGPDFLRTKLNFYNRRDFRSETSLNLLERWGCLRLKQGRRNTYDIVEPPPEEYLDKEVYKARVKEQTNKLYRMVEWANSEDYCLKNEIYKYFGVESNKDCGLCDFCLGRKSD